MPIFSKTSTEKLKKCDKRLQEVANAAIEIFDFTILEGFRDEEAQDRAYHEGNSQLKWPDSKHNKQPSQAIDIAPYPINWSDKEAFYYIAGIMMAIAHSKGIKLRWGGAWDGFQNRKKQRLVDLPHFEVVD